MKAETKQHIEKGKSPDSRIIAGMGISLVAITVFSVVAFFWWTLVPQLQTIDFSSKIQAALDGTGAQAFLADDFMWSPNTYAEGIMRAQFLSDIFNYDNTTNYTGPNPMLDKGIAEMDDFVKNNPSRYDYYLALGKADDAEYDMKEDPSYLTAAEGYYQDALAIIHGRQDVIYPYAINLINQGRAADAITLLQNTLAADPDIVESHFRLGEAYAILGSKDYDLALDQLEYALSKGFDPDPVLTKDVYQKFLRYFYADQDLPRFTTVVTRLEAIDATQGDAYAEVLSYIGKNHAIPVLDITTPSGQ